MFIKMYRVADSDCGNQQGYVYVSYTDVRSDYGDHTVGYYNNKPAARRAARRYWRERVLKYNEHWLELIL